MSANANGEVNLAFSSGSVYSLDRESETPKISFPNGEYDDSDQNPYSYIPEQSRNNNTTASQQNEPNDGYEMPIEVLQHHRRLATQERERKVRRRRPKRLLDSWFNRVVICLIVLFSAVAIFLVLLLMLGKVGPKCTSCDIGGKQSISFVLMSFISCGRYLFAFKGLFNQITAISLPKFAKITTLFRQQW